jgi:hypothetical protein
MVRVLVPIRERLAFQYLFAQLNGLPSRLVFLDFYNAADVQGPESEAEWRGATRLIHALLGLPADLREHGVFHAYVDAKFVANTVQPFAAPDALRRTSPASSRV